MRAILNELLTRIVDKTGAHYIKDDRAQELLPLPIVGYEIVECQQKEFESLPLASRERLLRMKILGALHSLVLRMNIERVALRRLTADDLIVGPLHSTNVGSCVTFITVHIPELEINKTSPNPGGSEPILD